MVVVADGGDVIVACTSSSSQGPAVVMQLEVGKPQSYRLGQSRRFSVCWVVVLIEYIVSNWKVVCAFAESQR